MDWGKEAGGRVVQGATGAMLQAELLAGIGSFDGGWTKDKNGQSRRIEKTQRQGKAIRQGNTGRALSLCPPS